MDIIKMLIALLYHYYLNWLLFKSFQDEKKEQLKLHKKLWIIFYAFVKNSDDFYK